MSTPNGNTTDGNAVASPKIILYTNHKCPYAHRAHITLDELKLPFEEVIIDLDTPRPQWYLDINPRGLVPSIKYSVPGIYSSEILTESSIVAQFLVDAFPSHLLPSPRSHPRAPLVRARINFFLDTWNSKVSAQMFAVMMCAPGAEREAKAHEWAGAVAREIEPLLADAEPFFGGSRDLTFAEVMVAPFVVRWYALAEDGEAIPRAFKEELEKLPNFERWARAVRGHESVRRIFDEVETVGATKRKLASLKKAE